LNISKKRRKKRIERLTLVTRKSKMKIKWTTRITMKQKVITMNSCLTKIKKKSQRGRRKVARLRKVSVRRANVKKTAMNKVRKKKVQSTLIMKQDLSLMRILKNHPKLKVKVAKSRKKTTNLWLKAQNQKLIVNSKMMANTSRNKAKMMNLQKTRITSRTTSIKPSSMMIRSRPLRQTKTSQTRLISKGSKRTRWRSQTTTNSRNRTQLIVKKLINKAQIYFSSLHSSFRGKSNRRGRKLKEKKTAIPPRSKFRSLICPSQSKRCHRLLMVRMIRWLMISCLMIRLRSWKENLPQTRLTRTKHNKRKMNPWMKEEWKKIWISLNLSLSSKCK